MQVLHIVVDEQYPHRSRDAAFFELGERLIESLKDSFMGPAMLGMLRLLGPKRGLERLNHNLRIANNYNQTRLTERGPNDFELWINEASVSPHFIRGTVHAMLKAAGVANPRVEIAAFDGQAATYRIGF